VRVVYSLIGLAIIILLALVGVGTLGLYNLFGIILPYIAAAIFIIGIIYRVIKWAIVPVPFHIPVTCGQQKTLPWIKSNNIENPGTTAGVIGRMALEVLLFRSLFRNEKIELKDSGKLLYNSNKFLWLGGLAFHWSLLTILFRHTRFFLEPVPSVVTFVESMDGMLQIVLPTVYLTDAVILIALTYLFLRRVVFPQIRYISLPSDYFAPLLITSVIISGILTRHFFKVDVVGVKEMAMGIVTFSPVIPEGIGLAFYVHLFLVCFLLAYFPFSKMVHAPGVFLSPTRNLRNDSRIRRYINPWDHPVKLHTYEEYEDDFRKTMRKAGLPLDKDEETSS